MRKTVGAALAILVGVAPALAQTTNLTIMVFAGGQNLPLMAAEEQGYFSKRSLKVDVKVAPTSGELRDGLAAGRYQIVHGAVDNAVAMKLANHDIAVVMSGDSGLNRLMVQPEIGSIADLKGKTVIVDAPNTAYALLLYKMLAFGGLKKGDYQVKEVGATFKRAEEIQKDKTVAASMLNPPFSFRVETAGIKDMGSAVKTVGPYQATAGWVMKPWAAGNGAVLERYIQAYVEGLRWVLAPANKAAATKMLADRFKLPPDIAEKTFALFADPTEGFAPDAKFDMEGFRNVLRLRAEMLGSWGGVPPVPDGFLDLGFHDKALKGL